MENWKDKEAEIVNLTDVVEEGEDIMYCACGGRVDPSWEFCPSCGRSKYSNAPAQDVISHDPLIRTCGAMTRKEFRKKYASAKAYKDLKSAAITGYVLVVVNVLVAVLMNPAALLDCGILLGLVLGFHLKRSKGCAVGLLCFNIFSILVTLLITGSFTGWMWLIVSVFALKAFNKMDKEYKEQCGDRIDL